jgi:hypothetical protein
MKFIQVILENSNLKEAKLYEAAKKASANPETGITIQNKSAYHVIKDCATITLKYLPLYVFSNYTDPFVELKGKFKRKDIEEFVTATKANNYLNQLLIYILSLKTSYNLPQISEIKDHSNSSDPYGEYGGNFDDDNVIQATTFDSDTVETLCKLFKV